MTASGVPNSAELEPADRNFEADESVRRPVRFAPFWRDAASSSNLPVGPQQSGWLIPALLEPSATDCPEPSSGLLFRTAVNRISGLRELAHVYCGAKGDLTSTRTERVIYRAMGAPVIFAGLVMLFLSGWLARLEWIKVAKWPRTDAVLVSKDVSEVGARLVFRYQFYRRRVTGTGFVWGPRQRVESDLASWSPGTTQQIGYDPENPAEVEPMHGDISMRFYVPVAAALIGAFFLCAGTAVYRWGSPGARPSAAPSA